MFHINGNRPVFVASQANLVVYWLQTGGVDLYFGKRVEYYPSIWNPEFYSELAYTSNTELVKEDRRSGSTGCNLENSLS